jgi:uncharacterized protein
MDLFLFTTALVGAALNAVAGGGSFLALPALLYAGVAPVSANATTTLALWPGSVASAVAYRGHFVTSRTRLLILLSISLVGGVVGGVLLVRTSDTSFMRLLPWLMLAATVTFTFGERLQQRLHHLRTRAVYARRAAQRAPGTLHAPLSTQHAAPGAKHPAPSTQHPARSTQHPAPSTQHPAPITLHPARAFPVGALLIQFGIATYGGYFGGGAGIMMLAMLSIAGLNDIHEMNGLKAILAVAINGVALAAFIYYGVIDWSYAFLMVVGASVGGYAGAAIARRMDQKYVRWFVSVVGWGMTVYFFLR